MHRKAPRSMSGGPTALRTDDGITLEARWDVPDDPRAAAVLCHPHPLYGGTMQVPLLRTVSARLVEAGCRRPALQLPRGGSLHRRLERGAGRGGRPGSRRGGRCRRLPLPASGSRRVVLRGGGRPVLAGRHRQRAPPGRDRPADPGGRRPRPPRPRLARPCPPPVRGGQPGPVRRRRRPAALTPTALGPNYRSSRAATTSSTTRELGWASAVAAHLSGGSGGD